MNNIEPAWDSWIESNTECYTIRLTREGAVTSDYAIPMDKVRRFISQVSEDMKRREAVAKSWRNTAEKLYSENMDLREQIAILTLEP